VQKIIGVAGDTTYKVRYGAVGAGTTGINGNSGARYFGGNARSLIRVREVFA